VAEGILDVLGHSPVLTLLAGVGLLFMALKFLVDLLRGLFSERAEQVLHNTLFRSAAAAILAGAAITVMVQSSSITTSTMIPLVGAGVVTLEQLFPFTIGANIGTTVTAILAALAAGSPAGIVVALSHLLFNVTGALLIYGIPLVRRVPLAMSRWLGNLGVRNRLLAISYIILAFYVLPLLTLIASGTIGKARDNGAVAAPAEVSPADERP
jgi:sodium-dependent phosphate cotransporter